MFSMVDCDASVLINGESVATAASVGFDRDGNYLFLECGGRRKLFVTPFTPQMISRWDAAHMTAGIDFQFSGTQVGFWSWGPLGHPGDGEFEDRSLKALAIRIDYSPACVVVTLRGSTEPGTALLRGLPDPDQGAQLLPWIFDITFSVPKAKLEGFLAIADGFYASFERCLDQCG